MFYTYLTWIGCLAPYGPSMAMPTIIILIKFLIKMKIIFWLPLTVPGGILFTWPLRPSQNNLSLWPKKNSLPTVSLDGGFVCVVPFLSTVKILAPQPSNTLSMSSKKVPLSHHVSKWEPPLKRCQGWRSTDCQNGQGPYHAGYLHRSYDLERLG